MHAYISTCRGSWELEFYSLGEMGNAMWCPYVPAPTCQPSSLPKSLKTFGLDAINTRAREMVRHRGRGRGGVFYNFPPSLTRGQKLSCAILMATSSLCLVFSYFHSRRVSLRSCQSSAGGLLFPRSLTIIFRMCRLLTVYCLPPLYISLRTSQQAL